MLGLKNVGIVFSLFFVAFSAIAQHDVLNKGRITGNFQTDGQYYIPDEVIGADTVKDKMRTNAYANINYVNGGFTAGFRYEFYLFPLIDFEKLGYVGQGIPYYYVGYNHDYFEVTVGSFYEQFGNGLIYRAYENRNLGYDNATNGIRVKGKPYKGIILTGIWGTERNLFTRHGEIRGVDGDFTFSSIFPALAEKSFLLALGASMLSKYEKSTDPDYVLPENVAAWATRIRLGYKDFSIGAEYAYKYNDPSAVNQLIYKSGQALFLTLSYATKGLGISLMGIRTDNMDFRTQRNAILNDDIINYIPSISREHTYALPAMYPYASQPLGQIGFQAQVNYQIKKKSKIGGKYGTDITVNYSRIHDIERNLVDEVIEQNGDMKGTDGYSSSFFGFGQLLFQDLNVEISRKFNNRWKASLAYIFLTYNQDVIEGHIGEPNVVSHTVVGDITCKFNSSHALRLELQHLQTKEAKKNWFYAQLEYSIAPNWFISVLDRWNYGNPDPEKRVHYYGIGGSFVYKTTKITLNFGKQYEGILCVGGVCRAVPASYGLGVSVVSSF